MSGQPTAGFEASPSIYNGIVYIGSDTGQFYAVSEADGSVLWSAFLGFEPRITCTQPGYPSGVSSTATVAPDPATGVPTVYVSGGNGYLFALDAGTGSIIWQRVIDIPFTTANDYYDWSSPTVWGGHIYIGVSSDCDQPLIRGAVKEYDQHSGVLLHTTYLTPAGTLGSAVWSSVAASNLGVFVTTGNAGTGNKGLYDAVVELNPSTMAIESHWTVPVSQQVSDGDFGGSPTVFSASINGRASHLVGACNKNGIYYTWDAGNVSAGPVWRRRLGNAVNGRPGCLAAASWDGSHLFAAGFDASTGYGTVFELDPANGAALWTRRLQGAPLGSPALDGAGVLSVPMRTGTGAGLALLDASTGVVVMMPGVPGEFAQATFADGFMFAASESGRLTAFDLG